MWDVITHVTGVCGLGATIIEFIYVWTNRDDFTKFEKVFFLTAGSCEMLGEVVFLFWGLAIAANHRNQFTDILKTLSKDPIHYLAWGAWNPQNQDMQYASQAALLISVCSVVPWAIFLPVWISSFDGDRGLRIALSVASIVLVACFLLGVRYATCPGSVGDILGMASCCAMYAMEKVFEVYILLSDTKRLISGDVGWWLVGFQILEVLSIALFFVRGLIYFNDHRPACDQTTTCRSAV